MNTSAKIIQVKIEFIQIGKIDTQNETFNACVKIIAKWIDNEVKDNKYDSKKDWNPRIYIENIQTEKYKEKITFSLANLYNETWITETRISEGFFFVIKL